MDDQGSHMADKRIEKTSAAIKDALAKLLAEKQLSAITVSDVAQKAGISRSTFYAHHTNTQDVYHALMVDFAAQTQSLPTQLKAGDCTDCASKALPFCVAVSQSPKWRAFTRDPQFLETFFEITENAINPETAVMYRKLDISEEEALALNRFQISGCYHAALTYGDGERWPQMRDMIDEFIRGGTNAIRSRF